MKRAPAAFALGVCILLAHDAFAAAPAAAPAAPPSRNAPPRDVVLPFEQSNLNIFVQVSVAQSKPLWFLLDTGARPAIIDLAIADELGLAHGDSVAVGGGGEHTVTGYLLQNCPFRVVGLAHFSQPLFLALPLDDLSRHSGRRVAGILGYEFLRQFVVEIDWVRHVLMLHDKDGWTYRGKGQELPITFNAAMHPQVKARLTDRGRALEGTFVLDLGSGGSVILNTPFVEQEHLLEGGRKTVPWLEGRGIGGALDGRVGRMDGLAIGRFRLPRPLVLFAQARAGVFSGSEAQGNIGAAILERFRLTLDYERNRIFLEPNSRFGEPMDYNRSGLSLVAGGDDLRTYVVEGVAEGSPAAQAGIAAGDTLAAVDGRPAGERTLPDLRELFRHARRCTLEVRHGGRTVRAALVLRSPI